MYSGVPSAIDPATARFPKSHERLLIVDSRVLLSEAIASAAINAGYGETLVAPHPCIAERIMQHHPATIVLTDLLLAALNDFEMLQGLTAHFPQTHVIIMIDDTQEPQLAVDGLMYGAAGLACRDQGIASLLKVIDLVRQGETAVPRHLTRMLVGALRQRPLRAMGKVQLSTRQREVLQLVAKGCTDKDISEKLHISLTTVRSHLTAIFEKTETGNRTAAALWASAFIDQAAS